jgi:hypothetical protein
MVNVYLSVLLTFMTLIISLIVNVSSLSKFKITAGEKIRKRYYKQLLKQWCHSFNEFNINIYFGFIFILIFSVLVNI